MLIHEDKLNLRKDIKTTKILIVEDEQVIALNVKLALQNYGYEIVGIAGNADMAIQLANKYKSDLILMDINLNDEIDGIDVAKKILEFTDTVIIFLTSYTDEETIARARLVGPFGYLVKPFDKSELYSTIEIALSKFRVEKQIRDSEERYRGLTETASDAIISINNKGDIISWNKSAEKVFGYKSEEVKGKSIQLIMPQNYKFSHEKGLTELSSGKESKVIGNTIKIEAVRKDAKIIPIELSISKWESADSVFYTAIIRDITERVKIEQELSVYRDHLEELVKTRTKELDNANKLLRIEIQKEKETELMIQRSLEREKDVNELKTRFISTVSHEFRTPLAAIQLSSGLLQRYAIKWPPEKLQEHYNRIDKSIENLTKLLDSVLTLSRADSGKIQFVPKNINLEKLCETIIGETDTYKMSWHQFVFTFTPKQTTFYCDPNLIRFIISNLLINAFKYTREGGEISLLVTTVRNKLYFTVKDSGIGILPEDIPYLFEPFYRGSNITDISGSGLGLSIVSKSVEMQKGKIEVSSTKKEGTIFKVMIPITKEI